MNRYEVVSVQEDNSITPYSNANIETATNQVVNDPNEVAWPTTGNIYADHRYDIKKIAEEYPMRHEYGHCYLGEQLFQGKYYS